MAAKAKYIVREREFTQLSKRLAFRGRKVARFTAWKTIGQYADLKDACAQRAARKTGIFERVVFLEGRPVVDSQGRMLDRAGQRYVVPELPAILPEPGPVAPLPRGPVLIAEPFRFSGGAQYLAARRFLLLTWKGWWVNDGPDHGRQCLFPSREAALAWARGEYPSTGDDEFHVVELPEKEREAR